MLSSDQLLVLSENDILTLSPQEAYTRMRLLAKIDAAGLIKPAPYSDKDKKPPKRRLYKNWVGD